METRDLPHDRRGERQEYRDQGDHERRRHAETREGRDRCRKAVHHAHPPPPPQVVGSLIREPISEQAVFESARAFLEQEFGVPVHVTDAETSTHVKALTALPFKPAIIIE